MSLENKKFMDYAGTTHLWSKIKDALDTKGAVDSVTAKDDSITVAGTAADPTIGVQISSKTGNALTLETTNGQKGLYVANPPAAAAYSITKDNTSSDYAAVYHLTKDGTNEGVAINIPKDMVVSSGQVVTKGTPGANDAWPAAGTYIELTLANATNDKLYIPVDGLIEYVTSGSAGTDAVVIAVDSSTHQVTASLTDGKITKAKLDSGVQASLTAADNALQAADITEGSANGTISVDGSNVAVHGLGSAAYTNSSAYDASGAATEVYNAIIGLTNNEIDAAIAAASTQS